MLLLIYNTFYRGIEHLENICKMSQIKQDSVVFTSRVEAFLKALHMDLVKIVEHNKELEELLQSREIQHQNNVPTHTLYAIKQRVKNDYGKL